MQQPTTSNNAARQDGVVLDIAMNLDLHHGRCVVVDLPDNGIQERMIHQELGEGSLAYRQSLSPRRYPSWVGGRVALSRAARQLGIEPGPLLPNQHGAPQLAASLQGSISHKNKLAAGLAALNDGWTRGVDIEQLGRSRLHISSKVLTTDENQALDRLPENERWPAVLLRFSIKEAIYKALHPWLERYVGFQELSLDPLEDGSCHIQLNLRSDERLELEARWLQSGDVLLCTSRARLREVRLR